MHCRQVHARPAVAGYEQAVLTRDAQPGVNSYRDVVHISTHCRSSVGVEASFAQEIRHPIHDHADFIVIAKYLDKR